MFFIAIMAAGLLYVLLLKNYKKTLPSVAPPPKASEKLTLKTPGGDVVINDITKNPVSTGDNRAILFARTEDYDMLFFPTDQGFIITLSQPDIQIARTHAEEDFLKILGINKQQACRLTVSLAVPVSISEKASGLDYGLSFCPGSKPLPKDN